MGVKGRISNRNPQLLIENQNGLAGALNERVSVHASLLQALLQTVDVLQADDGAFDLAIPRFVGADAKQMPTPLLFLDLTFPQGRRVDRFPDKSFEIFIIEIGPDFAQTAAQISREQVQEFLCRRG